MTFALARTTTRFIEKEVQLFESKTIYFNCFFFYFLWCDE